MKQGPYICEYVNLQGVSQEVLEQIPLAEGGHVPDPNSGQLELVFGNKAAMDFTNSKTKKGYWDTGEMPKLDMNQPFFVIFDQNAYYQSQYPSEENAVKPPKNI